MKSKRLRRLAVVFAMAAGLTALSLPAASSAAMITHPDAVTLARAAVADPSIVVGAAYTALPPNGSPVAVATDSLASFPTSGGDYAILTTGDATLAPTANTSESSGADVGGAPVRGNTDFDVVVLRIDLDVPASANCLVGMDFRFLSEEYPEYVGTRYNDAFIAELDRSTWRTSGVSDIVAPDNFAFDPQGNPITINAAGATSMTSVNAGGTTYDGATPLLTAATPITPGPHTLYLSIFDQGDHIYDSAVFVDNLRFGRVGNVTTDCKPGAELADEHTTFVGLGDSYSSGFGMEPFFAGTHKDGTSNDCQRSQLAFAPLLDSLISRLTLDFHACQGATTEDFYFPREGGSWNELPQLDYLDDDTGLVTFSIGGNDAHFSDILKECILGFELLPFNTCYNDDKVTKPIAEAFARLDGQTATPTSITPFDTLLKDVRSRTPYAARVQVGYPPFFTAGGSDRTWLPGGRCEGVKKADQRWMVEKIAEMNGIIERNALRNGFVFANPTSRFLGHELCSGDDEWFYPILSAGKYHPNQSGHIALASSIVDALEASGDLPKVVVGPGETVIYRFTASGNLELLSIIIEWPGSDVVLSLTSPSGKTYTRDIPGNGVYHAKGLTWEQFQIPNPEPGEWKASLFGANVKPGGEDVTIHVDQEKPRNKRPVGVIDLRRNGADLVLDGSRSSDPDGHVVQWDWYVSTAADDLVYQGQTVSVPPGTDPQAITLVVTDNEGLTDFVTMSTVPIDVKPVSPDNPMNVGATGKVPVALLSTPSLDATTIDPTTLRLGPKGVPPAENGVHAEDVNGDGKADVMLQFVNQEIGLVNGMTSLCLRGALPDKRPFTSCDRIRTTQ